MDPTSGATEPPTGERSAALFARIITFQVSAERMQEETGQRFRERVLPVCQKYAGFRGALRLLAREQGKRVEITLWESEEQAHAATRELDTVRAETAAALGAPAPTREAYEVLVRV